VEEKVELKAKVLQSWREMEQVLVSGAKSFQRLVRRIKNRRDETRRILLRRWYTTPWDAGSSTLRQEVVDDSDSVEAEVEDVAVGPLVWTADGRAAVQEVEDRGDGCGISESEGVRKKKSRSCAC
jgi:hypothetical protein